MSGAAGGYELFTEEDLLRALGGAAGGCEPFTEEDLPGALSGAAGGCEREPGEKTLLVANAVLPIKRLPPEAASRSARSFQQVFLREKLAAVSRSAQSPQQVFFPKSPQL